MSYIIDVLIETVQTKEDEMKNIKLEAYYKGLALAQAYDNDSTLSQAYEDAMWGASPRQEIIDEAIEKSVDDIWTAFFSAGFCGCDMPVYATGYRYGDIPERGYSENYRDNTLEAGVSVAKLTRNVPRGWGGPTETVDKVSLAFIAHRKRIRVQGWVMTHTCGADGEPVMVGTSRA